MHVKLIHNLVSSLLIWKLLLHLAVVENFKFYFFRLLTYKISRYLDIEEH